MPQLRDYNYVVHHYGDHDVIYEISDKDETGTTKYYGFLAGDGAWIIQSWNTSTDAFRYCKGASDYTVSWGLRASLTYVYYNQLLP